MRDADVREGGGRAEKLVDVAAAHEGRRRKGLSGTALGVHAGACAGLRHQCAAGEARILRGRDCGFEARRPDLEQQLVVAAQQRR